MIESLGVDAEDPAVPRFNSPGSRGTISQRLWRGVTVTERGLASRSVRAERAGAGERARMPSGKCTINVRQRESVRSQRVCLLLGMSSANKLDVKKERKP